VLALVHWFSVAACALVLAGSGAQNIVSELSSSPTAYHGAPANQFHSDAS
jgi:hypothetical protein